MIHLLVALMPEARPLIDHFRLHKRKEAHPFPIYANDDITLVVSGIGKIAAAAAVGCLQGLAASIKTKAWLNIGIAGHGHLEIGQGFLAHRVEDQATERCYYPPLVFPFSASTSALLTVDRPAAAYPPDGGVDMEASGFYPSALRSATAEWVHCYKVVSDNPEHPVQKFEKARATALIAERLGDIEAIVSTLSDQGAQWRNLYEADSALEEITQGLHFTETRKAQLKTLLRRWRAKADAPILSRIDPGAYANAQALLDDVQCRLAAHPLEL